MSQVTDFDYAAGGEPTPTLGKVLKASALFALLFNVLLWCTAILVAALSVAMIVYRGPELQMDAHGSYLSFSVSANQHGLYPANVPHGRVIFATLPLLHRLAYVLVALLRSAPVLGIFWTLRELFRLYAKGVVFDRRNALLIQRVGVFLIVAAFMPFAGHLFLSLTGQEIDRVWFHPTAIQELVLGGLVYVIALVMQVGREIEEDRSQFV